MCGCGNKVVTPITPLDWTLTFNGETISLHPSIGNWNFECQSHYWIKQNKVEWAGQWSKHRIDTERGKDHMSKRQHYQEIELQQSIIVENVEKRADNFIKPKPTVGFLIRMSRLLKSFLKT
jgi:Family of unknown function (DUF6527)